MVFKNESMLEIYNILHRSLQSKSSVNFIVLNPDICSNCYSGETIYINKQPFIYRGYKNLVSLAELLNSKMLTPKSRGNFVELTFVKLEENSFHNSSSEDKYGVNSEFFKINKLEESTFLYYYIDALNRANIKTKEAILNLGVNRGDEFLAIKKILSKEEFNKKRLVGVDYSISAINEAKNRFSNIEFYCEDINRLDTLNLGKFDCLISIGTMQSSSLNSKSLLMSLVTKYLTNNSSIILGFPNCRWIGGEMVYGAKVPHYNFSEMGLLFNDIMFAKRYLQQKKYRVTIRGKEYIFLVATKIRSALI